MRDNPKSQIRGLPDLLIRILFFRGELDGLLVPVTCICTNGSYNHLRILDQSGLYSNYVNIPVLSLFQEPGRFRHNTGKRKTQPTHQTHDVTTRGFLQVLHDCTVLNPFRY